MENNTCQKQKNNQTDHSISMVVEVGEVKMLGTNGIVTAASKTDIFLKGDIVIVESDRGHVLARALENSRRTNAGSSQTCDVVRRLSPEEAEATLSRDANRRKEAEKQFKSMVKNVGLNMKLSNIEITRDDQKIVFYFTAPGRVDFRQLVRDLAHVLRSRIELRQIGVRDETKVIGGLGVCGQPLCCALYMKKFAAVSMNLAKDQDLTQSPQKYSGMCGRLMCCLAYEVGAYKDLAGKAPRKGSRVSTPKGDGQIVNVALLRSTVRVKMANGDFENFPFSDVTKKK